MEQTRTFLEELTGRPAGATVYLPGASLLEATARAAEDLRIELLRVVDDNDDRRVRPHYNVFFTYHWSK